MYRRSYFVAIMLFATTTFAGPTHIKVIIAAKTMQGPCDTTDVGYVLKEGEDEKKLNEAIDDLVRKSYPDANVLTIRGNDQPGASGGTYVVIVNGPTTEGICTKSNFGVGFGKDKNEALAEALKDLAVRAPSWSQGKKDYSVEVSRQF